MTKVYETLKTSIPLLMCIIVIKNKAIKPRLNKKLEKVEIKKIEK